MTSGNPRDSAERHPVDLRSKNSISHGKQVTAQQEVNWGNLMNILNSCILPYFFSVLEIRGRAADKIKLMQ